MRRKATWRCILLSGVAAAALSGHGGGNVKKEFLWKEEPYEFL